MNKIQKSWRVFCLNLALSGGEEQWQHYLHRHQDKIFDFDSHSETGLIDVYINKALKSKTWYQPKRILSRLLEAGCIINPITFERLETAKNHLDAHDSETKDLLNGIQAYLKQHLKEAPTPLSFD